MALLPEDPELQTEEGVGIEAEPETEPDYSSDFSQPQNQPGHSKPKENPANREPEAAAPTAAPAAQPPTTAQPPAQPLTQSAAQEAGLQDRQYLAQQNRAPSNEAFASPPGVKRNPANPRVAAGAQGTVNAAKAQGKAAVSAAANTAKSVVKEGISNAASVATGDPGSAVLKMAAGNIASKSAVGRAALGTAENVIKLAEGPTGWLALVWKYRKPILAILLILVLSIVVVLGGLLSGLRGDDTHGVGMSNLDNPATSIGPNGFCKEMVKSLVVKNVKGNGVQLQLPTTFGGFSEEDTATISGENVVLTKDTSQVLAYGLKEYPYTPTDVTFYSNARWQYVAWYWDNEAGHVRNDGGKRYPALSRTYSYYAGKRVIIYNPKKKKGVVTDIADTGPAAWTGIRGRLSADITTQQAQLWKSSGTGEPRIDTPPGYLGRVIGAPKAVEEKIGVQADDQVIFGFAKDQSLTPGTEVTCTPDESALNQPIGKSGQGGGTSAPLAVPGVKEGGHGDCGIASTLMITLFYNPTFSDPAFYDAANMTTTNSSSCVSPNYINTHNVVATDFVRASVNNLNSAVKSVQGGDPVIIYTSPGSVYDTSKHIFVLVGFDNSDQTFWVNNPYPGGVDVGTKTPNNHKMTLDNLKAHINAPQYNSDLMIRRKYLDTNNGDRVR